MTAKSESPSPATAPEPTTKLRRDTFLEECAARGLKTTAAIAAAIRMSERQVDRVVNEGNDPSGRFIGRTLAAWRGFGFRHFFAVVDETTGEELR